VFCRWEEKQKILIRQHGVSFTRREKRRITKGGEWWKQGKRRKEPQNPERVEKTHGKMVRIPTDGKALWR